MTSSSSIQEANASEETRPPALPGDICPDWCGDIHVNARTVSDGRPAHPDDAGVYHLSPRIDSWFPLWGEGEDERAKDPVTVEVEGFRHDSAENWPDMIVADGVMPDCVGGVKLRVPDARRLAEALLLACDLADGIELPEVLR